MTGNKVFNDNVHGDIVLCKTALAFVDGFEFQRLRNIKQLGLVYRVFPTAAHNRFEHSLGTYHLAGEMVEHLRTSQPELQITDQEALCVKLAGLCHDLGHGPFSHLFSEYVNEELPNLNWKHESASAQIVERIWKNKQTNLSKEELVFIQDLINGSPHENYPLASKKYLFQIVANKKNSLDVDKLDYLQRDCYNLGMGCNVSSARIIKLSRVIGDNICFNSKDALNIYQVFCTRYNLFKSVYLHRVSLAHELMTMDAFRHASPKIAESVLDLNEFLKLNDGILDTIMLKESCVESHKIIERIYARDLYKLVRHILFSVKERSKVLEFFKAEKIASNARELNACHIRMLSRTIDLSVNGENPLALVSFYSKTNLNEALALPSNKVSLIMPNVFEEPGLHIFVTQTSLLKEARNAVDATIKEYLSANSGSQLEVI